MGTKHTPGDPDSDSPETVGTTETHVAVRVAAQALLSKIDNTDGMTRALYRSHLGANVDALRAALENAEVTQSFHNPALC